MLKALAAEQSTTVSNDTNDESVSCQDSMQLLPDSMDSTFSTGDTLCLQPISIIKGECKNVQKCKDNNLVIEKTSLVDTDRIQQYEPKEDGIINISFFHEELHRTFDNHARGIECQFKDWKLVNTRRCGFRTQFFYKCNMCHYEANFWSHPKDEKTMDINTAITAGTITTGIGYAQMEEMFAAANVPCMSQKTYIKNREVVLEEFEKTAFENMKKAGELERQLAVERNDVINGYACIPVVADGSWLTRSYGKNFDSLSGVVAIIGYYTKKVLYVGIRNKFCTACQLAQQKEIANICRKNDKTV